MKTKHHYHSKFISLALFGILLACIPLTKTLAVELATPQLGIESVSTQLKEKMAVEGFSKDFKQITNFVESAIYPYIDFYSISALVLGKHWKNATTDEKKLFEQEFKTLLIRTYSRAFVEFKDWSVRYLPLNMVEGANKVIVKTEILQPGIQPIAINYRMHLTKGQWKAYDIMIEGVSLITNYRTSFKNEMTRFGSLTEVIDALAKRNQTALAK
ncbi:MAG: ABC transporter substrate-binding protein [Methylococcales bacterium]|nr:ABC transporter substrate-binding protein [Methylococcales bacterium]